MEIVVYCLHNRRHEAYYCGPRNLTEGQTYTVVRTPEEATFFFSPLDIPIDLVTGGWLIEKYKGEVTCTLSD